MEAHPPDVLHTFDSRSTEVKATCRGCDAARDETDVDEAHLWTRGFDFLMGVGGTPRRL